LIVDFPEDSLLHEEAATGASVQLSSESADCSSSLRIRDAVQHLIVLGRIGEWSHLGLRVKSVAHLDRFRQIGDLSRNTS
jgi:hypothetical protein